MDKTGKFAHVLGFRQTQGLEDLVGPWGAFLVHTFAVYLCALHFFPFLAGRLFILAAPFLHSSGLSTGDLYLRHLEFVSIVPALFVGFLAVRQPNSPAIWVWTIPTLVLLFEIIRYHGAQCSVLLGCSGSTLRYFFEVQRYMPTMVNLPESDPSRVLVQMTVTAPFYSAVAYSLGAVARRHFGKA